MPLDDVLDHFDWEEEKREEEDYEWEEELVIPPDAETVCIMRFPFSWQAELAKLILRKAQIPSFVTNSLTSNMMHLEWTQVDLYVRAEEAAEALTILEENRKEKGEFPE